MPQFGVALSFAVGAALLVGAVAWVATRSGSVASTGDARSLFERLRAGWFVTLTIGAVAALALTIPLAPYPAFRLAQVPAGSQVVVVRVTAHQFGWDLSTRQLPAGRPVRFDVTSQDVNHAFGVYDEQDHLVAQVQAMPGYTNSLIVQFDRPGHYLVRCLELCGGGHAGMIDTFCVGNCAGG